MTQARTATRRTVTAGIIILAVIAALVVGAIALWPEGISPSGGAVKRSDLAWEPVVPGIELPVSDTAGPSAISNGLASDFARSRLGAALAAVHLTYRTIPEAGADVFGPTIREQVTGTNVEEMLARVTQEYEDERGKQGIAAGRPLAPGAGRPLAYKVTGFDESEATVRLFAGFTTDASKFFSFDLQVVWLDDDWHLVAPADGNVGSTLTQVATIPKDAKTLIEDKDE